VARQPLKRSDVGRRKGWRMDELEDALHARIVALSQEGNDLQEIEEWEAAIATFEEALALLPDPKYAWKAATSLSKADNTIEHVRRFVKQWSAQVLSAIRSYIYEEGRRFSSSAR